MGRREEAVDAAVHALCECSRSSSGSVALVALCSAVVGIDGLRSIGSCVAQASSLASHITCIASQGAAHLGCESRGNRSRDHGSAGDGSLRRREDAGDEREDDSGVLHGDTWVV